MTPFRLILDRADWENLSARLSDPVLAEIAADNRRALDVLHRFPSGVAETLPRRLHEPDGEHMGYNHRVDKVRLQRGAAAWFLERREEDAEDLRRTAQHLAKEPWNIIHQSSGLTHFDLRSGDLAYNAAFVIDVLSEVVGPELVATLERRLVEELLPAYLAGIAAGEWWCECDFNWGSACHGNAGFAALLLEEDHPELAATVLREAKARLQPVIQAMPVGGAWIEGMMYQSTAVAHLTDFVAALHRVHGDDLGLGEHPGFHDCIAHRQEQRGGDGYPLNFSNIDERTVEVPMAQTYWWAARWNEPAITAYEDAHRKPWWDVHGLFHDVEALWYREPGQASAARATRRAHHFAGLDWFAYRGERWWLGLRGGRLGGNHGNLDLGQVIVGRGDRRWLIDPGYGAGTTAQHNLPTVRNRDQTDAARGPIIRRAVSGDDLHLAVNLREAHPWVLDRWVRHVLVLGGDAVVIVDDLVGSDAKRLSLRFHLQLRGEVAVDGDAATVTQDGESIRIDAPGPHMGLEPAAWEFHGRPITDLSWRCAPDACRQLEVVALHDGDQIFSHEPAPGGTRLRLGDRSWTLDHARVVLVRDHG